MSEAHLIVVTHTPLRLRRTLLGVACQRERPASVTVTCDSDDEAIVDAAGGACDEFGIGVTLLLRARHELSRAGQARNNAVRYLLEMGVGDDAALVFIDGDCVLEAAGLAKHQAGLRRGGLVIGWRFDMTEAQTAMFDEAALRRGDLPVVPTRQQWDALRARHRRFRRQALLRRIGLAKGHKPKLLGANFSMTMGVYRGVNGHDESFEDWGQEDDDLGRRVYMAGHRPVVAVANILAFHQWHETRAPRRLEEGRNAHRLERACQVRCPHGLVDPVDQRPVRVMSLGARR